MSDKDMIIELLGIAEVAEDGTVDFTDRAKKSLWTWRRSTEKRPYTSRRRKKRRIGSIPQRQQRFTYKCATVS